MRKTFMFGILATAIASTGAVLVSHADGPPKTAPSPRPRGVELVPVAPPPQPGPLVEPTPPRLRATLELPSCAGMIEAFWSPDGKSLALRGENWAYVWPKEPREGLDDSPDRRFLSNQVMVVADVFGAAPRGYYLKLPRSGHLVGFTATGSEIITAEREYNLVSGRHRLHFWPIPGPQAIGGGPEGERLGAKLTTVETLKLARTVNLDSDQTYGYAFVPGGKSFRTVSQVRRTVAQIRQNVSPSVYTITLFSQLSVQEVDLATGATVRTALTVPGEHKAYALSPAGDRFAAVDQATDRVTVWDVVSGEKVSAFDLPPAVQGDHSNGTNLLFSPDARRLLCVRQDAPLVLLNADKGEPLPTPEGAEHWSGTGDITADGRFLVLTGAHRLSLEDPNERPAVVGKNPKKDARGGAKNPNPGVAQPARHYFWRGSTGVWEVATGKRLQGWDMGVLMAVHPTRPVVAFLESNDAGGIRLGLWDIVAETPEKK